MGEERGFSPDLPRSYHTVPPARLQLNCPSFRLATTVRVWTSLHDGFFVLSETVEFPRRDFSSHVRRL